LIIWLQQVADLVADQIPQAVVRLVEVVQVDF
jgi:hypothetical protein